MGDSRFLPTLPDADKLRKELDDLDPLSVKLAVVTDNPGSWVSVTPDEAEQLGLIEETALGPADLDDTPVIYESEAAALDVPAKPR